MNNRQIKFRVWHKKEKRFLLDGEFAIDAQGGVYYIGNNCGKLTLSSNTYTNDVIIQQFTGLKDIFGSEIYEGDFFEVALNRIYQIKFSEGGESNYEWYGGGFTLWLNDMIFFPFDEFAIKNGKIIGNVCEHPELIKNA